MTTDNDVTIIICTTAEARREACLLRAIDSILNQTNKATPLLVVNGNRFEAALFDRLKDRDDLNVIYQAEGSLAKAIEFGRQHIETTFFGYLDDDDVLLVDAISKRIAPLERDPNLAAVVANGERITGNRTELMHENILMHQEDPLLTLLSANWLASCAGLFRSKLVTAELFSNIKPYHEWTDIAFRIALSHKIHFIPDVTYQVFDSPESLSKSNAYQFATLDLLENMSEHPLPKKVTQRLVQRISAAHHDLSSNALASGDLAKAWKHHLQSMSSVHGMRYLPFTRHLIFAKQHTENT